MLAPHVQEAAFELADAAVNPSGYADDEREAERRAKLRDTLCAALVAVVEAHGEGGSVNDRYWILDNPDPEDLSGYVAIVDEEEGGILLYVVAHRAENVLRRLTRIGGGQ